MNYTLTLPRKSGAVNLHSSQFSVEWLRQCYPRSGICDGGVNADYLVRQDCRLRYHDPAASPSSNPPLTPMPLFADAWTANSFELSLMAAAVFGLLGIAMLALGFKVFEWITPRLNVEQELVKGNIAVGIMVGALLLGISFIIVRAIGG